MAGAQRKSNRILAHSRSITRTHNLYDNLAGFLDFNSLGNRGIFHWTRKQFNFLQRSQKQPSTQTHITSCFFVWWCFFGGFLAGTHRHMSENTLES